MVMEKGESSSFSSIKGLPSHVYPIRASESCIYTVPSQLRASKEEAYTPQNVSIGPFHAGKKELSAMQPHKVSYVVDFSKRIGSVGRLREIRTVIEKDVDQLKRCYSHTSLDDIAFVNVLFHDSIFLIELFLRNLEFRSGMRSDLREKDSVFDENWLIEGIKRDLLLIENQLPFSLLNKIYESTVNLMVFPHFDDFVVAHMPRMRRRKPEFLTLCLLFLDLGCSYGINFGVLQMMDSDYNILHFVDMVRYFVVKHVAAEESDHQQVRQLPKVVELDRAGIIIEKAPGWTIDLRTEKRRSWIPYLHNLVLQIPQLEIHQYTESMIRNVMAFEQRRYASKTYLCNYMFFLDSIIDSEKDVLLLIEKGIIVNNLGHFSDVAKMINSMSLNITRSNSCYFQISQDLKVFHSNWFNKTKATLKNHYFGHAGIVATSIVAFVIFGLALTQTIFSGISYTRPGNST